MGTGLVIALVAFAVAVVMLAGLLGVTLRMGAVTVAVLLVAAAVVVALWRAETPFGIGDGTVPELRRTSLCDAESKLAKRGLTWHHEEAPVRGSSGSACAGDAVERQQPAPGTHLGEGGVVRIWTECRPYGCAVA